MTLTEQQAVLQILICIACNANLRSSRSVVGSHVPLIADTCAHELGTADARRGLYHLAITI